ncbi:MAG: class I SAM-dependent methyltransferase [Actinomadura sp.]
MGRVSTARRWARYTGIRPVAEAAGSWLAARATPAWIHRHSSPTIRDFTQLSGTLATSGTEFLERLGWPRTAIEPVVAEFDEVIGLLEKRYHSTRLAFPKRFGVETETGIFIYAATRLLKPANIVETGVADGRSSFFFLAALERNGSGLLHSFDINPAAGGLVGDHEQWRLAIVDREAPENSFIESLRQIRSVDLFFHDSDHRYLGQYFEYAQVWPMMAPDGLFSSDDVDCSKAFVDFCRQNRQQPEFLFDNRKVIGGLRTT